MPIRYVLQNSIPIGVWSNSYTNYNCYAYSRGLTWWMNQETSPEHRLI